ncbi:hypothetical protein EDC94DRAFT_520498 [Helicostylum pulchrum]|nr:hypothetical protein EDC94DRAFT_520498 [Helicostylum pulchrum]
MVRFKNRWVLFQIAEDPVIDNGRVVYPKTKLEVNDNVIGKTIFKAVELNYGEFGKGQGSVTATIPCSLHILHVSGTVIFIQQKAIEWDRRFYLKEQQYAETKGKKKSKV